MGIISREKYNLCYKIRSSQTFEIENQEIFSKTENVRLHDSIRKHKIKNMEDTRTVDTCWVGLYYTELNLLDYPAYNIWNIISDGWTTKKKNSRGICEQCPHLIK